LQPIDFIGYFSLSTRILSHHQKSEIFQLGYKSGASFSAELKIAKGHFPTAAVTFWLARREKSSRDVPILIRRCSGRNGGWQKQVQAIFARGNLRVDVLGQ
jgi:hypothetical protein